MTPAKFIAEKLKNYLAIGMSPADIEWIIDDALKELLKMKPRLTGPKDRQ